MSNEDQNPMKKLRIGKVVINMAVGTSGEKLAKAATILEMLTGQKPSFRKAKKTIKEFGIKRGENIACVITLTKNKALEFLKRALEAVDYKIKASSFDEYGNFSFGIKEHISLPGVKYDPALGIFGFDVCVTIERPGYRVANRRRKRSKIGKKHRVTREESMKFVQELLGVKMYEG
ncbi:MAG: 50S ribosomal protein L5 [Candidatus Nezhaarchaeota archaeon]|nr:50S ribosomal protein L5 [Candidatus Nezhaarchaeota archaeon]MCX8141763.1 50S ribosomal protein L5 [Candidatus Nezhaarchaeota archaeon]MDW8050459.1 50S ribosomal protein L5 [Nitrososphaerota archaeon]